MDLSPPQPSLPTAPRISANSVSYYDTASSNPYGHLSYPSYQPSISSHYAQACMQMHGGCNNPQLSAMYHYAPGPGSSTPIYSAQRVVQRATPSFNSFSSSWYQPGNSRCTYTGCLFTGSPKAVEIHMMDRHLIYPPGWEQRKKNRDWDADPSLKGKPIPIQGTNIILDAPGVLEAWISERKLRWPSKVRVEEKKRKLDEAIARGQTSEDGLGLLGKRRRVDGTYKNKGNPSRTERSRGRGRARGFRGTDGGWSGRGRGNAGMHAVRGMDNHSLKGVDRTAESPSESSDSHDDSPEIFSSKPAPGTVDTASGNGDFDLTETNAEVGREVEHIANAASDVYASTNQPLKPPQKKQPLRPKKPPRSAFSSRSSLLHNLLLPEIRMTVSNLSQAIRFLVDNDFLENVELMPGGAEEKMIMVIGEPAKSGEENLCPTDDRA